MKPDMTTCPQKELKPFESQSCSSGRSARDSCWQRVTRFPADICTRWTLRPVLTSIRFVTAESIVEHHGELDDLVAADLSTKRVPPSTALIAIASVGRAHGKAIKGKPDLGRGAT